MILGPVPLQHHGALDSHEDLVAKVAALKEALSKSEFERNLLLQRAAPGAAGSAGGLKVYRV
jgi:hypothetical protein